jgi:serine/threonine-protein kinase
VPPPIPHGIGRALDVFKDVLVLFLMVGSALLARRMVLLGRGDWRGATTVAAAMFIVSMIQWVFSAHHVPDYGTMQNKFFDACADQLFRAGIAWLAYLGIEPWIRRHWPTSLISWTRVLAGSWRDPLVGRDMLIGIAFGVAGAIFPGLIEYVLQAFGGSPLNPAFAGMWALTTPRYVVASLVAAVSNAGFNTLLLTLLYVVLRRRLRRPWLALAGTVVVLALVIGSEDGFGGGLPTFVFIASISALIIAPLHFHGLLPFMAAFAVRQVLISNTLTADLGAWYAGPTWVVGAALIGLTVWAFLTSRAGAPTFGRLLEE